MATYDGSFTPFQTGVIEITGVGFRPDELEFRIGAKNGLSNEIQFSTGWVDSTGDQSYTAIANGKTKTNTNHCLYHYETISSVVTKVIEADFHSMTNDGFKLTVVDDDSNYTVFFRARKW